MLNPVTVIYNDASGNAVPVTEATPLPTSATAEGTDENLETIAANIGATDVALELTPADPASVNARLAGIQSKINDLVTIHEGWDADTDPLLVVGSTDLIPFTPSCHTSQVTTGQIIFTTEVLASFFRANSARATLQSMVVIDLDDQGIEMDIVFLGANSSLGTEGSAPDIDDTEILDYLGHVKIGSSTAGGEYSPFIDLGANRVATRTGIGLVLEPSSATTSIWIAGIARATATFTASGLRFRFGEYQD